MFSSLRTYSSPALTKVSFEREDKTTFLPAHQRPVSSPLTFFFHLLIKSERVFTPHLYSHYPLLINLCHLFVFLFVACLFAAYPLHLNWFRKQIDLSPRSKEADLQRAQPCRGWVCLCCRTPERMNETRWSELLTIKALHSLNAEF